MTPIDRPSSDTDLERRLHSWMGSETSASELPGLYEGVIAATRVSSQRPWFLVAWGNRAGLQPSDRAWSARRIALVVVTAALLTIAAAVGLVVGARFLAETPLPRTAPGAIVATGDIPVSVGWLVRPAMTTLADGRVLLVGGGQESAPALVYDPALGRYGDPIFMSIRRQGATATTLPDGRVLVTGGNDGQFGNVWVSAALYDPATETFAAAGSMAAPRDFHTATLLDDGRVLIIGGQAFPGDPSSSTFIATTDSAEIYDPATGTFTATGRLATSRAGHSATKLSDGRVVVIGGYSTDPTGKPSMAATAEIYDPASGTFRETVALGLPRAEHGASLLPDGRVLVVGGGIEHGPMGDTNRYVTSAELFDPERETFEPTGSLTTERGRPSATLLPDGRVLVVGGYNAFGSPHSAELYDPVLGRFDPAGMTTGEHPFGLAPLLADGRVFLAGAGQAPYSGSELYVPSVEPAPASADIGQTTEPTSAPHAATRSVATTELRSGHTATRLLDGRVLIAGGYGGEANAALASAEIFDPATGRSTVTWSMTVPRSEHVATLRSDGRVLVAGNGPEGSATAEVFDPATGTFSPVGGDIAAALVNGRVFGVANLSDGRLVLQRGQGEAKTLMVLDVDTGALGPAAPSCYHASGAGELVDGTILISCGHDPSALIFDPVAGTSRPVDVDGWFSTGPRLDDGHVVIRTSAGGQVDAAYLTIDRTYDPATGTVTRIAADDAAPPMTGTITRLDGDRLLTVGGSEGNLGDAIQLIDTTTWAYRDAGRLATLRADPTVTVLLDGRALIVGGASRSPDRAVPLPPGAELFDPAGRD